MSASPPDAAGPSAAALSALFSASPAGLGVARAGAFLVANPALGALLGRAPEALVGVPLREFVPARLAGDVAALGPGQRLEAEVPLAGGRRRARVEAVGALQDGVVVVHLAVTDVTLRHHAMQEAREAEARFRVTFDEAPFGMSVVSPDRVCLEVNRRFAEMLGYAPHEIVGRPIADMIHPDDELAARARFEAAMQGDQAAVADRFLRRMRTRDGRDLWIEGKGSAVVGSDGRPRYFIFQVVDVTDRVAAEQALRESEARFRVAFEAAPYGMALLTVDARFLRANRAACQIFGYAEDELRELSWYDLVQSDLGPPTHEELAALVTGGDTPVDVEEPARRKDGTVIWVRGNGALVRDEAGLPQYFLGQFQDVSAERRAELERRQLEEQLRRSQRMETVGRLAGGVAHDFNNMLSVVINCAELARMRTTEARTRDYVDQIHKAATRAAGLTRRLMIFGRKDVVIHGALDLNQVVTDLRPLLQRSLGEDVALALELASGLDPVCLAVPHVEQVLLNLVVNSRDAMPRGGRLAISTRNVAVGPDDPIGLEPGPYVALAVEDTGVGIPPELQPLVFEPFFTTKEVGKGTGLGLAIVHHIVESAGGRVRLTSAPGRGTTFEILLPVATEPPDPALDPDAPRYSRGRGQRVLVVEDEPTLRDLVAQLLAENGYAPMVAPGPEAALDLLRGARGRVDLVVTDVVMPGMSGPELVRRVREAQPELRVLYMSGYAADRLDPHDLRGRATSFLPKPFHVAELLEAVRRVLDDSPA